LENDGDLDCFWRFCGIFEGILYLGYFIEMVGFIKFEIK
jgi:hypothetical protein